MVTHANICTDDQRHLYGAGHHYRDCNQLQRLHDRSILESGFGWRGEDLFGEHGCGWDELEFYCARDRRSLPDGHSDGCDRWNLRVLGRIRFNHPFIVPAADHALSGMFPCVDGTFVISFLTIRV